MPTYSYFCNKCEQSFELFFYIKDYQEKPKCAHCKSKQTERLISEDVRTLNCSVKKSDTELKTIGDLAKRNSDKMSSDEKNHLHKKHNEYKINKNPKPLPKGMNRITFKQPKTKWPGT